MDQETQQQLLAGLQLAKTAVDAGGKTGVLQKVWGAFRNRQSTQPLDYQEVALKALRDNALETLATVELTVAEAANILESGFTLDDLGRVNRTWQKHWAEGVSRVSVDDDERRTWWARLLAGEIQQPGTYSLRTLAVMDTLSMAEAQLFTKLCAYVWECNVVGTKAIVILPQEKSALWTPSLHEQTLLSDSGLALRDDAAFGLNFMDNNDELLLQRGDHKFLISNLTGKESSLRIGELYLTTAAMEVWKLTEVNPMPSYIDEMVAEWQQSFSVSPAIN